MNENEKQQAEREAEFDALIDVYQSAQKHGSLDDRAEARRALKAAYRGALAQQPQGEAEPLAWRVEWNCGADVWVQAHASEVPARDQAAKNGGTCTPLYAAPPPVAPVAQGLTFDEWAADNIPEFQRRSYSALDVTENVRAAAEHAWNSALAHAAPGASARQAEPVGWKLVPVTPTKEMWDAVNKLDDEMAAGSYDGKGCSIEQAWECLLAAAPAPTESPDHAQALRWATQLAQSLHRKYYAADAPNWEALPDLVGVISQIDNMTTGLSRVTESASPAAPFQARVQPWMLECFGAEIAADQQERNHRFLEEALELVQACGATASEAHQLVDYVYDRPVGEKHQEAGGVMVTLAALCLAHGLDMHAAGETELARIWTKVEQIRAKQAAKPKHSPLPQHVPAASPDDEWETRTDGQRVRKDRWEDGFRSIVSIVRGPRGGFEIPEIIEQVRALVAAQESASPAALADATRLPERVIDTLISAAGVSTFHPDGDQLGTLHEFAHGVANEVLARIPRVLLAASPADQENERDARYSARDLYKELGYRRWQDFDRLVGHASQLIDARLTKGAIRPTTTSVPIGSGAVRQIPDYIVDQAGRQLIILLASQFKMDAAMACTVCAHPDAGKGDA